MTCTFHRRAALLLLHYGAAMLLCLALPTLSAAQAEFSAERKRQAGEHFERGIELYSEGNLDAALVAFERAYELAPSYRVLFNLGQIQAERHQYAAALELFEKYLADGDSWISDERKEETNEEIRKLRERVAELWVESDADGAQLFVDDKLVATLPLSENVLINPGLASLRVEKDGYRPATRSIKVTSGERLSVEIPLGEPAQAPDTQGEGPVSSAPAAAASYRPFWLSSAAALVAGGTALTFGLLTRAADHELTHKLEAFPFRATEVDAQRSKVKTYAGVTDGFAAATLVGVGLAVYFLIAPPERPTRARQLANGKLLRVLPSPGGVALFGRF
ncbi:MAG TPA: PEGA domain-containing protein [Polyangiales bacterium]